jgi:two-component sensor histidine kinase
MNSIKHAFGPDGGRIKVSLVGGIGYGEARLTVSDDGRGLKNPNKDGSGLKLIASLAKQIGGAVNQESSDRGTTSINGMRCRVGMATARRQKSQRPLPLSQCSGAAT